MGAIDSQGLASLDPRGFIGRIYVGDHYSLLHTKYIICGPHGFSFTIPDYSVFDWVCPPDCAHFHPHLPPSHGTETNSDLHHLRNKF